jgi:hypothetical protein
VLTGIEKRLHRGAPADGGTETPPLLTLENYLFRLIGDGLRAAHRRARERHRVLRAAVRQAGDDEPQERAVGRRLVRVRVLLAGRWRYGWRGRTALNWILGGTLLLVLGYLGSKFVLEVVLHGAADRRMDDIPLVDARLALAVLLLVRGFFSVAETAMMATNRYRLKHRGAARLAQRDASRLCSRRTDQLLGVILLGNTCSTRRRRR